MPSRRRSRRGATPRSAARRRARRPGRRGRRGTARCPCAGSGGPAPAGARSGLRASAERRARAVAPLGEQPDEPVVLDVAGGREHDVRRPRRRRGGTPAATAATTERDHVGAADHRPAERVRAEHGLGGDVVDEILRVVLDHRDLLEHDLALGVDLGERRLEDHVGHHVERVLEAVVGHARVDDRRLARGGGVQLAAHARRRSPRSPARVVARRALEQQVLDEVRDAGLRASARRASRRRSRGRARPSGRPSMRSLMTRSPPGSVESSCSRTRGS